MGSGSSTGLTGRYGLAFVRLLRERSEWFHTHATPNCWWTGLREDGYDPTQGYGFSLLRADGGPAVKIWIFVDDFAIHGPACESTCHGRVWGRDDCRLKLQHLRSWVKHDVLLSLSLLLHRLTGNSCSSFTNGIGSRRSGSGGSRSVCRQFPGDGR